MLHLEPHRLTPPQTAVGQRQDQHWVLGGLRDVVHLAVRQIHVRLLALPGQFYPARGVRHQPTIVHSVIQDGSQYAERPDHRRRPAITAQICDPLLCPV
ncbi:hypothetical protein, partial [Micrococcus sp. IITD107]|uniref:hypothetical protein n=1 Tax=Micrococcus sp. IITD107 TaxID=3342790 RepID=UPI0035BA69A1